MDGQEFKRIRKGLKLSAAALGHALGYEGPDANIARTIYNIDLNQGVPSRVRSLACLKCLMLSAFPARGQAQPRSESMMQGPNGPADRQPQMAAPRQGLSRFATDSPQSSPQSSKKRPLRQR
jgi:hypothetical protein